MADKFHMSECIRHKIARGRLRRTFVAGGCREAHEHRSLFFGPLKEIGLGYVGQRFVILEIAVRAEAACVNHSFGNALEIKVK